MDDQAIAIMLAVVIVAANVGFWILRARKTASSGSVANRQGIVESMTPREWLLQSIRFFRQLGFYGQYSGLSDEALADKLEAFHQDEWRKAFNPSGELADLSLLRWDTDRVWWEDTEADVLPGSKVYVETLQEWARISRGTFMPEAIKETWGDEEGPIAIRFTLEDAQQQIQPRFLDDFIDVSIAKDLNRLIEETGFRFEIYEAFDQTAFIIVLTADEKQRLERERGWRFMPY